MPWLYNGGSRALGLIVAVAVGLALPARARAGDPPVPPATPAAPPVDKAPATDPMASFIAGEKAFEHGDYLEAAHAFEAAYRASPHPDALWNAARAWDHADETARAANVYARYLDEAPAGARDRDSALQALTRLAAKLGRIDVVTTGIVDVIVDDQPLHGARVYVTPGAHVVRGRAGPVPGERQAADRPLVKTATVAAGEAVSVALVVEHPVEPEKADAKAADTRAADTRTADAKSDAPRLLSGWQRVTVGAGTALTLVAGAVLVWSGVDTLQARSAFDHEATPQALEDGRAKQARTNALVATTAALGAVTLGATIVFATRGRAALQAHVGFALGGSGGPLPAAVVLARF